MPEEIPHRLIKMFSFVGDTILDPFCGSGTTLKKAKELNRNYIGYEIYKNYSKIINKKINNKKNIKNKNGKINYIIKKDIIKALDEINNDSVDLIIADPPYNISIADWDKFKNEEKYLEFCFKWISKAINKLKDDGSFYLFNNTRNSALLLPFIEQCGLTFQNWITWYKKDGFNTQKNKYVNNQETILFFTKNKKY